MSLTAEPHVMTQTHRTVRCRRRVRLTLAVAAITIVAPIMTSSPAPARAQAHVTNMRLPIDVLSLDADGRRVALGVREFGQGADFNGDGDINDVVVHVYDASSGLVTNLGVALAAGALPPATRLRVAGDDTVFLASETGDWEDYDGNGQVGGHVLHRYSMATGMLTNLGVPALAVTLNAGIAAVAVDEVRLGEDLNGDGDTLDAVLATVDLGGGAVTSLKVAVNGYNPVVANGDAVAFLVSEGQHGATDLNGDGDASDHVLHSYRHVSQRLVNHGLPGSIVPDPMDGQASVLGPVIPFHASEPQHGADLNGDGDVTDTVVHAVDSRDQRLIAGAAGVARRTPTAWLPESVLEGQQSQDINGDGDRGDQIVRFRNVDSGAVWNTGLSTRLMFPNAPIAVGASAVSIAEVSEILSGTTDLNGDGDVVDELIVRFDPTTQASTVFNVASQCQFYDHLSPVLNGQRLVACRRESVAGIDLTGDGDMADTVQVGFNIGTGVQRLGRSALSTVDPPWLLGKLAYILVDELSQGQDLNGDGDRSDTMIHRFDVDTGITAATTAAVHINSLSAAAWAAGSTEVFFGRSENGDRRDYNGDGDILDVVLHVVR